MIRKLKLQKLKEDINNPKINPLGLKIGKVRLEKLHCRNCNTHIPKGSNCLFTRWTWCKYCLECGKNRLERKIEDRKKEVSYCRRLMRRMKNFKLVKENMCVTLGS